MQPRHPVLRVPTAIGPASQGRPRARALAAALGLVLTLVTPVAGAPPPPSAQGRTALAPRPTTADIPAKPPTQAAPAPLAAPPGATRLISIDRGGGFANAASAGTPDGVIARAAGGPSVSSNGRFVAFPSAASDLVAGDNNRAMDVFLRDRRAPASTIRLPVPGGAPPALGRAIHPSISADGSAVAFAYVAPPPAAVTFVPPCASRPTVVLWRRATGTTEVVSFFPNGTIACPATEPSVSADGRYVAFTWTGSGDTAIANREVYVRDTVAGTTVRASSNQAGSTANADSFDPAISADGRIVAYASEASDLVAGDANKVRDVFAYTMATGSIDLVSVGGGGQANGPSEGPAVSADGGRIAFESRATNLVAGTSPNAQNVFVRDRAGGGTILVSSAPGGGAATGDSGQASISADGAIVAFASAAPNLLASADNAILASLPEAGGAGFEVYARDTVTGQTIRVSDTPGGAAGGSQSLRPAVAGNGRFVAFESTSALLVAGDTNKVRDVFFRDMPPAPAIGPATLDFGTRAVGVTGPPLAAILTNAGWGPLTVAEATKSGAAAADFEVVLNSCLGRALRWLESCPVTVVFTPTDRGGRVATLAVAHNGPGSPATVRLLGGGSLAVLKLDPPIGQPGIVTIATGSGFPANTQVSLAWSRGISPNLPPITTDGAGNFRVQVLVFHNDIIGARDLVASPVGSTVFPPFGVAFLVLEASSQPPRFIVQAPYDERPPTLVMRR